MSRRVFSILSLAGLLGSLLCPYSQANAFDYNPNNLVSDTEMLAHDSMSVVDVHSFLTRGGLGDYRGPDHNDRERSAAEIIWNAAQQFKLSPKFLLTLLQREQSLVEDDTPSEDQLAWAMGYAVCDDCRKDDPLIQKFKGFGKQVYHAAKRIRESYLTDLSSRGTTITGIGPGIEARIDDEPIIPANHATSVLYTYTPHLHGNKNFVKIWRKWFENQYPSGSLLQHEEDGSIWLIQNGERRPITSQIAFHSRFDGRRLLSVGTSTLANYPIGSAISFPNYALLRSPLGTVYLLVDDKLRGIQNMDVFRSIGFNPDEIVDVSLDDLAPYQEALPITASTSYPQGALLQDPTTGGIFYVENSIKHAIRSREIMESRFPRLPIKQSTTEELATFRRGDDVKVVDGTLIGLTGSPEVFIVADGMRHHIADEATFRAFGWEFSDVVWMNERSILVHELGDVISNQFDVTDVGLAGTSL